MQRSKGMWKSITDIISAKATDTDTDTKSERDNDAK